MKLLPYLYAVKDKIFNRGMKLMRGNEFYRYACRHNISAHSFDEKIKTSLHQAKSYAFVSQMVDRTIEDILDKQLFTPKKFLAIIDPYRFAPLTALLVFNTKENCRIRITVQDANGYCFESEEGQRHRIPIMHLRAGRKNPIFLQVICKSEIVYARTFFLRTCPLPDMIENMVLVKNHKSKSASALTFVYGGDTKFPYAFDENGEIRYYLSKRPKAYGLFPLSGGRFLFLVKNICNPSFSNPHAVLAYEMDFLGRVYQEYYVPDGIHHDGCEMSPGGNILTVSSSLKQYVEDAIIELDRATGQIVKKLCLETVLSEHPYFDYFDWAHINTVSWCPEEHAILLCARNLHSVIKIDWKTDELLWIFCDTSFWRDTPYADKVLIPDEGTPFSYQAHAAYFLPELSEAGNRQLIIFDNHWHARRPIETFDGDKSSHVRIYEIDENAFTVKIAKNYKCPKSKIRSNGLSIGKRVFAMCGFLNKKIDDHAGVILEYSKKTGKVINRYLTYNSFYRAYPFFADCEKTVKPMNQQGDYLHCSSEMLSACQKPNIQSAHALPQQFKRPFVSKETAVRRGPDKFERMRAYHAGHEELDNTRDLAEMEFCFYDELLLIGCRDHLLEAVYIVGEQHSFCCDYTNTEQKSPALFESARYYLSLPVRHLPLDNYTIYVQSEGILYAAKHGFVIEA